MLVLAASSERSGQAAMTLRDACRSKRVPPEEVLAALRQVEAANQQQAMVQGFPSALTGKWRLVFSSPSPIKQWQYIPIPEFAEIDADAGTISLVSILGPVLSNSFKGSCTFDQDPASGRFVMNFSFSSAEARWFGRWNTKSEVGLKRKSYTFFLLDGDLAAANSSGGPKTLMSREQ
ncbi:hypothetical protein D9Q98_008515 [Chlorella vulgaris]|uniref:Plastid lipid-associated protein/fibrillin conserved domain-containing protein n=1 Tax=Chlorella vulgaris TaxID=3077 RepID=A0A9D4YU59_CHLVU|nr:hypothetical protein D9Q98_008515 [Chlorella vulgaris]